MISRPTGPEPVKAMVCTPGWRTSAAPASPSPGSSASASGGTPASRRARTTMSPQPGACSAGLRTTRVARGQAGGRHAHGDRDREVPRRDDRHHAARRVAHLVALAGDLEERLAAIERDGAAGVELEEVDGLADVGVGLVPGLGALAHRQRGELGAPRAHPGRRAHEDLGALGGGGRRPAREAARGGLHRLVDLGLGGARGGGDDAVGPAGIGGLQRVVVALAVADPHGHAQGQRGLERGHARRAARRAPTSGAARRSAR